MRTTVLSAAFNGVGAARSMDDPGGLTIIISATGTSLATTTSYLSGLDNYTRSVVVALWGSDSNNTVVLPPTPSANINDTTLESLTVAQLQEFEIWAVGPNGKSITVLINGSTETFVDGTTSMTIPCGTMSVFRPFGNVLGTGKHLWAVK